MTRFRILALALAALVTALPAFAGGHGIPDGPVAEVDVLPGWRTPQGTHMAALRITLAPGWKTYWRAPGDAGIPPRFGWSGSRNLSAVQFHWPRPEVYTINGMRSIGYYGELILPIELTPTDATQDIALTAKIEMGVCQEVCIPMTARISADLNAAGASDARIATALNAQPTSAREGRVAGVTCRIEPIRDGLRLTAQITMPAIGSNEVAVFELPDQTIWISEAASNRQGAQLVASSDLVPPSGAPFMLDRSDVRITVFGDGRAVEMKGCSG